MTPQQIAGLEGELTRYLERFDDCFGRSEPRGHLAVYVRGQLSNLRRKSVEPIALEAGVAPRTLQKFLAWAKWDHGKLRDRVQQIVASEHCTGDGVLIVDETSHKKKGDKTPGVQRQHCGSTGKIDNCVVTVHIAYSEPTSGFRTLLDSDLFLPENGWDDAARRAAAHIPEDVVYRPKHVIAIEEIDRALANGVRFGWVTADEGYGGKPPFIEALEKRELPFVLELPRNTWGWFIAPLTVAGDGPKRIDNLCRHSDQINRQPWVKCHVKDTEKGPIVWEHRAQRFWMRRDGRIRGPYLLIHARNVLCPGEEKYFLVKAPETTRVEHGLKIGFSRFPIERSFQDGKSELGLSHYEGRSHRGLIRHCHVTAMTHLFLARQTERLRGGKTGCLDSPSPQGRRRSGLLSQLRPRRTPATLRQVG